MVSERYADWKGKGTGLSVGHFLALLFLSQQRVLSWKPADACPPSYFYRIYDAIQIMLSEVQQVSTKRTAPELQRTTGSGQVLELELYFGAHALLFN